MEAGAPKPRRAALPHLDDSPDGFHDDRRPRDRPAAVGRLPRLAIDHLAEIVAQGIKLADPRRMAMYFAKYGTGGGKEYRHRVPGEWITGRLVCEDYGAEYDEDRDECPDRGGLDAELVETGAQAAPRRLRPSSCPHSRALSWSGSCATTRSPAYSSAHARSGPVSRWSARSTPATRYWSAATAIRTTRSSAPPAPASPPSCTACRPRSRPPTRHW